MEYYRGIPLQRICELITALGYEIFASGGSIEIIGGQFPLCHDGTPCINLKRGAEPFGKLSFELKIFNDTACHNHEFVLQFFNPDHTPDALVLASYLDDQFHTHTLLVS